MSRELKVGLLVIAALAVLGVGIFLVGEKRNLFHSRNDYFVRFPTVAGLASGNPVQLNGVVVGEVHDIVLPQGIEETLLTVWVAVDKRFAARVRVDSVARIKTVGLLGDKYIEITSGSADAVPVTPGGEISAAPATDVDQLLASGEDVVENVVAISHSLRDVLGRMQAGEGILGELTTDSEAGKRAKESLLALLDSAEEIGEKIERGDGLIGTLLNDDELAGRIAGAVTRLEGALTELESGEGALPALMNDPEMKAQIESSIDDLSRASSSLATLVEELDDGDGLLNRLLADDEYGRQVSEDLAELMANLNRLSGKLERGEGSVGALIDDPEVYEALKDVIVGINESRMLRWLVRNRQKAGIKKRYEDAQSATPAEPAE